MAATRSKDFLLKRWDGAAWQTVGGLRATSITVNNEQIDTTNKDGTDWRQMITGGIQSLSFSGGGIFEDGVQMRAMHLASINNTFNDYRIIDGNGNYVEAEFQITSFALSGDHTGALEYSMSLESSGDATLTQV